MPRLVYDSGNDFERFAALEAVRQFHENHDIGFDPDARSCLRGPEPEGVVLGRVGDMRLAMISLESTGGVMIYNVTSPEHPQFLKFLPPHLEDGVADCAPEGLAFISAEESPTGTALLIVANEISGITTAYQLKLVR